MVRIWTRACATAFLVLTALVNPAHANAPERPVVFVPGITGSVLSDGDGEIVWGDIGSLRGSNFHKMNLLPADGEPMPMTPTDALRDVPLLFGTIEVGLYSGLIDFLGGKKSLRERFSDQVYKGEYTEGENLFVFAYDWRRSNFANALALDAFIQENIPEGEFDLIAHSMGGLVTRIMLSQQGPNALCTSPDAVPADMPAQEYQDLCTAIYGASPSGEYPSDHLNARRESADRLHTFIEMAVPHYGSVNLAATMLEGWGKVSELLLGGKRKIQNTVLSMAAPVELLPTYENCCARGKSNRTGNKIADPFDEEYWLTLLLAFGQDPCPYDRCAAREALFRNGIANRKIIDGIMDAGLPDTVKANHGVVGRQVKNTRETIYVDFAAKGDGDGITYRVKADGDGTVHSVSAKLPENQQTETVQNFAVVMHASHPFIIGDEGATNYVYNVLVDPIPTVIEPVSANQLVFADGAVGELGMDLTEQVLMVGDSTEITLRLTEQSSLPFNRDKAKSQEVRVELAVPGSDESGEQLGALTLNDTRSLMNFGRLVYDGAPVQVDVPGIYTLRLVSVEGTELAKSNLYVLEK